MERWEFARYRGGAQLRAQRGVTELRKWEAKEKEKAGGGAFKAKQGLQDGFYEPICEWESWRRCEREKAAWKPRAGTTRVTRVGKTSCSVRLNSHTALLTAKCSHQYADVLMCSRYHPRCLIVRTRIGNQVGLWGSMTGRYFVLLLNKILLIQWILIYSHFAQITHLGHLNNGRLAVGFTLNEHLQDLNWTKFHGNPSNSC